MTRVLRQMQFGNDIHQIEALEYDPDFDAKAMRSRMFLETVGGNLRPVLWLYSPDIWNIDTYGRISSYFWEFRARGSTAAFLASGLVQNVNGATFFINHWNSGTEEWDNAFFINTSGTPYMRLSSMALILGDQEALDANVNVGQVNIWWNDTNKRLKGKDNSTTTYNFGYNDRGDPVSSDFTETDLTLDGNWNDLNLSSIVPAGAKCINLHTDIEDSHKGHGLEFRKNGNSNSAVHTSCLAPANNAEMHCVSPIACDSSRIIEYRSIVSADSITITVNGWWI